MKRKLTSGRVYEECDLGRIKIVKVGWRMFSISIKILLLDLRLSWGWNKKPKEV